MLGEELSQQPLMRARRRVVERGSVPTLDELTHRSACFGGKLAASGCEPSAAETERTAGAMAEHHGVGGRERRMALGAEVERWCEAQFGHDTPGAGERRRERLLRRRNAKRVQRGGHGVEETDVGLIAPEAQGKLGDG